MERELTELFPEEMGGKENEEPNQSQGPEELKEAEIRKFHESLLDTMMPDAVTKSVWTIRFFPIQ